MARFGVLIFALAMVLSSADGWAYDKNGRYLSYDYKSCGEYLDAYSRTTLIDGSWKGPHEFWKISGWINGYLSAYDRAIRAAPVGRRSYWSRNGCSGYA